MKCFEFRDQTDTGWCRSIRFWVIISTFTLVKSFDQTALRKMSLILSINQSQIIISMRYNIMAMFHIE